MSGDEVEKFEITDYDLDNEFNINRPRRRPTKHQQIYGIWADESDDEDDNRKSGRLSKSKVPKNYSAPIGFVSGGIQNQKKKDGEDEKSSEDDEESITFNKKSKNYVANSSSESEDDSKPSFSRSAQQFNNFTETSQETAGLRKTGRPSLNTPLMTKGVGNWERHTKGIGAKLLLQMGYKPGMGLGKDLQGIARPVEAHLRKGRGAIGAYGPEKAAKIADEKADDRDDNSKQSKDKQNKWKKEGEVAASKKSRYYYKSVDDVIERGKQPGAYRTVDLTSNLSKVKVIDMRGPEQRVLSGYHALSGPKKPDGEGELFEDIVHKKCSNFALPELQHNLDLLVDICEQDIIWVDRKKRHCCDRVVALEQERKGLTEVTEKQGRQMKTLQSLLDIVERLVDPSHALSLRQVADEFKNIQESYFEEYLIYDLGELAPGLVGPLLTSALVSWNPLTAPNQYTDVFQQWKEILDQSNQRGTLSVHAQSVSQPYNNLVWSTWMPVIRATVSTWSPRDCDPLIRLLDIWKPIIPMWIMENLLEQVILPQINSEVLQWNPLTDTVPIHVWIHPWIPLMGQRLQDSVYPIIEDKLGTALTSWHPSDRSAKLMLRPWQPAMSPGAFAAFLHKYILPKLQVCLSSLHINPHQQHLDAWNWVMDWSDMLSPQAMSILLDKCFLPRWLQTLALWLNQQPNYTEVTDWFIGWKGMFSEQLLQQPAVKECFRKALELMNRAVKQPTGQPGALETVSYLTNLETNLPPPPPPIITNTHSETLAHAVRNASQMPQSLSFKDIIAKNCEERGILFVPIPNRYREAKQVYRIGNGSTQCYIDKNVVFATTNGTNWAPTNLNNLLDIA